jgi:hypothetical protein
MVETAAKVWNTALGKDVFVLQENGNLQINLVYDARQDATLKLQSLGLTIRQDQASYDALKEKYNSLLSYYNQQQSAITAQKTAYNAKKSAYESQVAYWQSKGGAPKNEYNQLEQQRQQLNNESLSINQAAAEINKTVDSINAAATVLNRLAGALNINAQMYNGIGLSQGEEFQEGVYKSTNGKTEIDIYQFDNRTKLVRVLIHEMGHALGVNHVSDPNAIMYEINSGTNLNLTAADISALKNVCNIK